MYCIKCGVVMDDGEKQCPLCKTRVYHPDYISEKKEETFPKDKLPKAEKRSLFIPALLTGIFLLPILIVTLCDIQFMGGITWSGYVTGALILLYSATILPVWFRSPNPVIFVPVFFATAILYLFYINYACKGQWFLTFALPVSAGVALIICAIVTLVKYLKKGRLFIFGGAFILFGAGMIPMEHLLTITFKSIDFIGWSFYPLITLAIGGGFLIFLGCYRPARDIMERKFFV